jgi:hypothetical protein
MAGRDGVNTKTIVLPVALFLPSMVSADPSIRFSAGSSRAIVTDRPALYPETVQYDPLNDRFVVGSFREGALLVVANRA